MDLGTIGLAFLAFIESSVFPLPPDVLLAAMSICEPQKALIYALICTIASTLGGALGYGIGLYGGRPAFKFLFKNQHEKLDHVEELYNKYGIWAVLGAAFAPIPYKIFTIASGIFQLNFLGFIFASFIGRGARFFIVALALILFGEPIKDYLELVIIALAVVVLAFYFVIYKKRHHLK